MAVYGRTKGRLRVSVTERRAGLRSRARPAQVRFRVKRNRPLEPEDVVELGRAYGLFMPAVRGANRERIDPALLDRCLWCGIV